MEEQDLFQLANQLSSRGMLESTKSGGEALPISLMVRHTSIQNTLPRAERKKILESLFSEKLNGLVGNGLEVDYDSLSVSGQTMDAKVEVNQLPAVYDSLKKQDIEVYPNTKMAAI